MKYKEIKKDLFEMDKKYLLAHCISKDIAMGAGIAYTFTKKFKNMKQDILKTINENKQCTVKIVNIYDYSIVYYGVNRKQIVFNLVTKEKCFHKPTYTSLQNSLNNLHWWCHYNNTKYLAMPKIGCGIDGLQWEKVSQMIKDTFKDLNIEIVICYL